MFFRVEEREEEEEKQRVERNIHVGETHLLVASYMSCNGAGVEPATQILALD